MRVGTLEDTDRAAQRARVVEEYAPLVRSLVRRFRRSGEPEDDLFQVGMWGLLEAWDHYEPERGPFPPYAAVTVTGRLRRHLRDRTWTVNVPRRVRDRAAKAWATAEALAQAHGRSPTFEEVARHSGLDVEEVAEALEAAAAFRPSSLDAPAADGASRAAHLGSVDGGLEAVEGRVVLDRLLAMLPEREQRILRLRFLEDLSQSEIARHLGISQMQVSRLLARSLATLRRLADEPAPPADAATG